MDWVAAGAYTANLLGTLLTQIGYILMKKGMHKVENSGLNGGKKKLGFFTWQWLTGFAFLAIGSITNVSVLPFCDLVVLSTIGALAILMNYGLSVFFLNETIVWRYDIPAILLIIGGSLTIVFLSDYSETTYTPDLIRELLWSTTTLVCFIVAVVFTAVTIAQYCWHLQKLKAFNQQANQFLISKIAEMQAAGADQPSQEQANQLLEAGGESLEELGTRERP
mmetsp:Transcript_43560/g.57673  ORF Transcript_43560/g.57673 Transcript_43560/m.57673 type:complete len:222 (+) Transcript_43560:33-698(+)